MNKVALLFLGLSCYIHVAAQAPNNKILFVIDSIPILNDPESWNQLDNEDIADIFVVKSKDSLKFLGWEHLDGITYIFTKAYRNRSDSVKRIPSLKQMTSKNGTWYLHGLIYSGKYIDYYNSGKIQNEGTLFNGRLNGQLIVYFKNGNKKSVTDYKDGVIDGEETDYYKNGVLMSTRRYKDGKMVAYKTYFINGQPTYELRLKNKTRYDTAVAYYSTGNEKMVKYISPGEVYPGKKEQDLNYYSTMFYQNLNVGNLKEANRNFYKLWLIDSTSIETYFKEGLLLTRESRFDDAIAEFDKALALEPLMREALVYRAIARIKKHKVFLMKVFPKDSKDIPMMVEDLFTMPDSELTKICRDLQLADDIDESDLYVKSQVPEAMINFCRKK